MTSGTYGGGTFGTPWGLGGGLYVDNHGRIYPQLYGGSPGFSFSGGYTPDLEGLLTGPSISGGPGKGPIGYNVGGNAGTIGAGIGTPGISVTHGFGPIEASQDYSQPWIAPAIRDSAARAGEPSRYNVFEYGYPASNTGSPAFDERWNGAEQPTTFNDRWSGSGLLRKPTASSPDSQVSSPSPRPTQPQGLAALLMDHIRRLDEQDANKSPTRVFDTGALAVPFIPDDSEGPFADRFGDQPPIRRLSSPLDRR